MSLGFTEPVEMDSAGVLINLLNGSTRGQEMLLGDVMPEVGGAGNGFLDCLYRLGCELPVLYGLVPELDMLITCWGRGLVVWGTAVGGEVGTIWNGNIVPELTGANWGRGWWSIVVPSTVAGVIVGSDGSNVVAHIESPAVANETGIFAG